MSRRVYCAGALGRPCPAHAWWFYDGHGAAHAGGRPRERCGVCAPVHELERRRENHRNQKRKERQLRAAGMREGA